MKRHRTRAAAALDQATLRFASDGETGWSGAALQTILPDAEGITAFVGTEGVLGLGEQLAAARLAAGDRVIVVDGAARFDLYRIKVVARRLGRRPGPFLKRLAFARGLSCHDMDRLVTGRLIDLVRAERAQSVILSGILEAYYDPKVETSEARRLVSWLAKAVRALGAETSRVFLFCPPAPEGRRDFVSLLQAAADRLFTLAPDPEQPFGLRVIEQQTRASAAPPRIPKKRRGRRDAPEIP
jgi:hypothetical protein